MDFVKLHENYMKLQSIPLAKMTIKERIELQEILEQLIKYPNSTEYDLQNYYEPRFNLYLSELEQIKQYIGEQIAMQEAIIGIAESKIEKLKNKLIQ